MAMRLRPGRPARLTTGPARPPAAGPKRPAPGAEERAAGAPGKAAERPELLEEVLIEEVSIDGMCGVY